ncbi:MAG: hypothetical protein KDK39_08455 [Leptospiraceae bacterium]|nr:hypothetical protein [Leptospiraceae bacterium]
MMGIITLLGLVVGALIFINLVHAKSQMDGIDLSLEADQRIKKGRKTDPFNDRSRIRVDHRMCPVCRTPLAADEYLMCAMDKERPNQTKRQVHIYGCPHCFITGGVNNQSRVLQAEISELHV